MTGYFIFDDIDTRNYQGIVVSEDVVDSSPVRVYEEITVAGRNGTLMLDTKRYENTIHSYDMVVYNDYADNLITLRNDLLSKVGYKVLKDSFNPDEKYMAVVTSDLIPNQKQQRDAGSLHVEFSRKPQRWLLSGDTSQTFTTSGSITNPTAFESQPLLIVTGAGILSIGNQALTIVNGSGSNQVIYIDCETQEAWEMVSGAMISRNDYIQNAGDVFPVLNAGENDITIGTGISRVEITPRWWRI